MHARKAASVLPDPVGAEISVVRPARMWGHPCSCGSVGVPNRETNHSATSGWAQARDAGRDCIRPFYSEFTLSPTIRRDRPAAQFEFERLHKASTEGVIPSGAVLQA